MPVKVISVTLCIKVVVLSSDQNLTVMIFKLNRKVKDLAKMSALTHKAKDKCHFGCGRYYNGCPKQKHFAAILDNLKVADKKTLFVIPEYNENCT